MMSRYIIYSMPLVVLISLAVLLYAGIGKDPSELPSPLIDKVMPEFALPILSNNSQIVTDKTLYGKPFLLNVWASWCVSCLHEHATLQTFARDYDVPIIGLNWKDNASDAQQWLSAQGNPYDMVLIDDSGRVGVDFGVYAAPETFLIDAQGIIRFKQIGPLSTQIIQQEIMPRLKSWKSNKTP